MLVVLPSSIAPQILTIYTFTLDKKVENNVYVVNKGKFIFPFWVRSMCNLNCFLYSFFFSIQMNKHQHDHKAWHGIRHTRNQWFGWPVREHKYNTISFFSFWFFIDIHGEWCVTTLNSMTILLLAIKNEPLLFKSLL